MPIKTNQLVAVEKGVKARAHGTISDLLHTLKKVEFFQGFQRTYRPKDDDGDNLPSERKVVQARALDILAALRVSESQLYDITLQKDTANQSAKASVFLDGKEVLKDIPVTTLLFFEKRLEHLRTFFQMLPVLDNAEEWEWDDKAGLYRTQAVSTHRNKKVMKVLQLVPPTDKHPGQAQPYQEDVLAGFWDTVKFSTAISHTYKVHILEQLEKFIIAVKQAREVANDALVQERTGVGDALFNYLLAA